MKGNCKVEFLMQFDFQCPFQLPPASQSQLVTQLPLSLFYNDVKGPGIINHGPVEKEQQSAC